MANALGYVSETKSGFEGTLAMMNLSAAIRIEKNAEKTEEGHPDYRIYAGETSTEIGGGWLVWQAVREQKPRWWAVAGGAVLMLYGFVPTLQPLNDFGRLYAVYGGVFIGMSFVWGYLFDGIVPDTGDWVGSTVALLGVALVLFWPREGAEQVVEPLL